MAKPTKKMKKTEAKTIAQKKPAKRQADTEKPTVPEKKTKKTETRAGIPSTSRPNPDENKKEEKNIDVSSLLDVIRPKIELLEKIQTAGEFLSYAATTNLIIEMDDLRQNIFDIQAELASEDASFEEPTDERRQPMMPDWNGPNKIRVSPKIADLAQSVKTAMEALLSCQNYLSVYQGAVQTVEILEEVLIRLATAVCLVNKPGKNVLGYIYGEYLKNMAKQLLLEEMTEKQRRDPKKFEICEQQQERGEKRKKRWARIVQSTEEERRKKKAEKHLLSAPTANKKIPSGPRNAGKVPEKSRKGSSSTTSTDQPADNHSEDRTAADDGKVQTSIPAVKKPSRNAAKRKPALSCSKLALPAACSTNLSTRQPRLNGGGPVKKISKKAVKKTINATYISPICHPTMAGTVTSPSTETGNDDETVPKETSTEITQAQLAPEKQEAIETVPICQPASPPDIDEPPLLLKINEKDSYQEESASLKPELEDIFHDGPPSVEQHSEMFETELASTDTILLEPKSKQKSAETRNPLLEIAEVDSVTSEGVEVQKNTVNKVLNTDLFPPEVALLSSPSEQQSTKTSPTVPVPKTGDSKGKKQKKTQEKNLRELPKFAIKLSTLLSQEVPLNSQSTSLLDLDWLAGYTIPKKVQHAQENLKKKEEKEPKSSSRVPKDRNLSPKPSLTSMLVPVPKNFDNEEKEETSQNRTESDKRKRTEAAKNEAQGTDGKKVQRRDSEDLRSWLEKNGYRRSRSPFLSRRQHDQRRGKERRSRDRSDNKRRPAETQSRERTGRDGSIERESRNWRSERQHRPSLDRSRPHSQDFDGHRTRKTQSKSPDQKSRTDVKNALVAFYANELPSSSRFSSSRGSRNQDQKSRKEEPPISSMRPRRRSVSQKEDEPKKDTKTEAAQTKQEARENEKEHLKTGETAVKSEEPSSQSHSSTESEAPTLIEAINEETEFGQLEALTISDKEEDKKKESEEIINIEKIIVESERDDISEIRETVKALVDGVVEVECYEDNKKMLEVRSWLDNIIDTVVREIEQERMLITTAEALMDQLVKDVVKEKLKQALQETLEDVKEKKKAEKERELRDAGYQLFKYLLDVEDKWHCEKPQEDEREILEEKKKREESPVQSISAAKPIQETSSVPLGLSGTEPLDQESLPSFPVPKPFEGFEDRKRKESHLEQASEEGHQVQAPVDLSKTNRSETVQPSIAAYSIVTTATNQKPISPEVVLSFDTSKLYTSPPAVPANHRPSQAGPIEELHLVDNPSRVQTEGTFVAPIPSLAPFTAPQPSVWQHQLGKHYVQSYDMDSQAAQVWPVKVQKPQGKGERGCPPQAIQMAAPRPDGHQRRLSSTAIAQTQPPHPCTTASSNKFVLDFSFAQREAEARSKRKIPYPGSLDQPLRPASTAPDHVHHVNIAKYLSGCDTSPNVFDAYVPK